jgi:hypothetical protein
MCAFIPFARLQPDVKLFDTRSKEELSEEQYFAKLLELHNRRNPHVMIGTMEAVRDDASTGFA